jgi:hypothetical protein
MSRDLFSLVPDFREAIGRVLSSCYEQGFEMRPYFTVRDPWTQARLWRQSRSIEEIMRAIRDLEKNGAAFLADVLRSVGPQQGPHLTDALPGLSWHQWGEAVDCYWYLDGEAEWSTRRKVKLNDGREINGYRLYGEIAVAQGLTSGGFWHNLVDWPHIQKRSGAILGDYAWPDIDREMQERFERNESAVDTAEPTAFDFAPAASDALSIANRFVEADGNRFCVNSKEFRFVGVNIRGLVHYGQQYSHGPGMPWPMVTQDAQIRERPRHFQLQSAHSFGVRVVRVFLANANATPTEVGDGLEKLLSIITDDLGYSVDGPDPLYLIPALTNFYSSVPFYVRGDNGEVHPDHNFYGDGKLTAEWYQGGYQHYYQPFVESIIDRFKEHPNIFAWEVGNELALGNVPGIPDEDKARLVAEFMHRMAEIIGDLHPKQMITTGMTSTAKAWMRNVEDLGLRRFLYEGFDFVTIHYPRDKPNVFGANTDDIQLAKDPEKPKPFIIEEDLVCKSGFKNPNADHDQEIQRGCEPCDDRAVCFKRHLEEWLGNDDGPGRGAGGYMIWGFDPTNINDGDPGGIGGIKNPDDWPLLRDLFRNYAIGLAARLETC